MRVLSALVLGVVCVASAWSQAPGEPAIPKRFGLEADLETYPQGTAKETLGSVLKAIGRNRIDYLLAHLADPQWVDGRVKGLGGKFDDLVKETTARLAADPATVQELQRFLTQGDWEEADAAASARLRDKDRPAYLDRRIFFRKVEAQWYFENRTK